MSQSTRNAGLDQPNVWSRFVDWEHVLKMFGDCEPRERKMRELAGRIIENRTQTAILASLRKELSDVISDIESVTRPENTLLIRSMAAKLEKLVDKRQ
jgi:hypothetical protein